MDEQKEKEQGLKAARLAIAAYLFPTQPYSHINSDGTLGSPLTVDERVDKAYEIADKLLAKSGLCES